MRDWTSAYHDDLKGRFSDLKNGIPTRLAQISDARTTPAIDGMVIGSAKRVRAAALFFDIERFTTRMASDDEVQMTQTLQMLNYVIPMVMHVIHDHDGYIEKNTGDGVMALFIADGSEPEAVAAALDSAVTCFYVLRSFINPHLESIGIPPVHARIGIDFGPLLISKIGVPTGSADHPRNFLTAVGLTANLACRLQQKAGTDQIWVGESVRRLTLASRGTVFYPVTPPEWNWVYVQSGERYPAWHFTEARSAPFTLAGLAALGRLLGAAPAPQERLGSLLPPGRR
jgi:adenylate cyclase